MDISKDIITAAGAVVYLTCCSCTAGMIVHCFYDETVRVTRARVLIIAGILTALIAFGKLMHMTAEDSTGVILILLYAPVLAMVAFSGKTFFGTVCAFFRVLLAELLVAMAVSTCVDAAFRIFTSSPSILEESILIDIYVLAMQLILCILLYFFCIRPGLILRFRAGDKILVAVYCIALIISGSELEGEGLRRMLRLFIVIMTITMPILIYKNRLSVYYSELSADNEKFLGAELAASRQYREAQEETRAFRHDIKNELTMLSALMKEKRYKEAEDSLNDMLGKVSELSPRIVTGDDMLDSLISSKLHDLEHRHIGVEVRGVLEGGLDWKPIDICSVFANAIDNAAEACMKLPPESRKYININFRKTEMQRVITIKNPTAEDVDTASLNSGRYHTSKPDKERHGFGVRNIRKTVEKYGGMLSFSCENGEFCLTIVLI